MSNIKFINLIFLNGYIDIGLIKSRIIICFSQRFSFSAYHSFNLEVGIEPVGYLNIASHYVLLAVLLL